LHTVLRDMSCCDSADVKRVSSSWLTSLYKKATTRLNMESQGTRIIINN
jgi:hypothetical protein